MHKLKISSIFSILFFFFFFEGQGNTLSIVLQALSTYRSHNLICDSFSASLPFDCFCLNNVRLPIICILFLVEIISVVIFA